MTDTNWSPQEGRTQIGGGEDFNAEAAGREDTAQPGIADAAFALDDTDPGMDAGSYSEGTSTFPHSDDGDTSSAHGGAVESAKQVAGHAGQAASRVGDTAVQKAAEVKDVAVERAGDVAGVAADELTKLAGEARAHAQDLWSQASVQLREQIDTGRTQLAELLSSLAGELGEMASASTQSGPVTALARQAAHRGGELSRWLSDTQPADLAHDIRRFARRRPVVFIGGAVLAGVLVGRLGRGLMAAAQESEAGGGIVAAKSAPVGVPATGRVTTPMPVSLEEVPSFDPASPASSQFASESTSEPPVAGGEPQ